MVDVTLAKLQRELKEAFDLTIELDKLEGWVEKAKSDKPFGNLGKKSPLDLKNVKK